MSNVSHLPTRVLLIGSAPTELDDQDRICGSLDVPLSEAGEGHARSLASQLAQRHLSCIYTAACLAARQTAKLMSQSRRLRIRTEDSWINLDHGLWHGKCLQELKENHPRFYRQWLETPESVSPPNGETHNDVAQRVATAVARIAKRHQGQEIAVVAPEPLLQILGDQFEQLQDVEVERLSESTQEPLAFVPVIG